MEKYLHLIFTVLLCVLPRNIVSRVPFNINDGDDNRIVGGYNTTIQEFPYQAYLVIYQGIQTFQCGGSIINSHYILTAAHCIIQGATMIKARIGSTNANSGGTQYRSLFFAAHPLYNRATFDYDVAYAYMMPRMVLDGTNARAVRLAPRGRAVAPGTTLTVSGWGTTMENGNVVENLMAVQVPVISSEQCNQTYSTITPRMICAGVPEGGKDSCQGDSGGPGVSDEGIQIAIVSYGVGCGRPGYPGVYTNVSSVRRWIKRITGV